MVLDLTSTFDKARVNVIGKALDELRQNYFIQALMHGIDDTSIGGIRINTSGRISRDSIAKKKEQQRLDDLILLTLLNDQITAIEQQLANKYGEDFAEQLAAELFSEEDYEQLMNIEDKDERRHAIARAINKGLKDGTIDPTEIKGNPDFEQWLDVHAEREDLLGRADYSEIQVTEANSLERAHDTVSRPDIEAGFSALFSKYKQDSLVYSPPLGRVCSRPFE